MNRNKKTVDELHDSYAALGQDSLYTNLTIVREIEHVFRLLELEEISQSKARVLTSGVIEVYLKNKSQREVEDVWLEAMKYDPEKAARWMAMVLGKDCIKSKINGFEISVGADMPDGKRYKVINKIQLIELPTP